MNNNRKRIVWSIVIVLICSVGIIVKQKVKENLTSRIKSDLKIESELVLELEDKPESLNLYKPIKSWL